MSISKMDLDEVISLPQLSESRIKEIGNFKDKDLSDCPELSSEQLAKMRPYYEQHPEWYKMVVEKTAIQIRIDNDVLEELKKSGKGYQTKINAILRKYVFG